MSIIGDNIRALRMINGHDGEEMTQGELAEKIGVSRETVNKWETGVIPNLRDSNINKLREVFGLSVDDLRSESIGLAAQLRNGSGSPGHSAPIGARRIVSGGRATMPLRSMRRAGYVHAGDPADEPDSDDEVMVPEDVAIAHPDAFALRVEGDCMDRVIPEGYDVIVDPGAEPHTRSVVVVRLEETGEVVMRRLVGSRQTMVLEADSHAEHDDLVFPADGGAVDLIGVVVWSQRAM